MKLPLIHFFPCSVFAFCFPPVDLTRIISGKIFFFFALLCIFKEMCSCGGWVIFKKSSGEFQWWDSGERIPMWFFSNIYFPAPLCACQLLHSIRADWHAEVCWDRRQVYWHEHQSPCKDATAVTIHGWEREPSVEGIQPRPFFHTS